MLPELVHPFIFYNPIYSSDVGKFIRNTFRGIRGDSLGVIQESAAVIPYSVNPGLLSRESRRLIRHTSSQIYALTGLNIRFNLYQAQLCFKGADFPRYVPWDIFTNFEYQGLQIAGPVLNSFGHQVMTDEQMSLVRKVEIEDTHLFRLINDWDLVCVHVPRLKDGSLTDKMFRENFDSIMLNEEINGKPYSIYLFRGLNLNSEQFHSLESDHNFRFIIWALSTTWQDNFKREFAGYPKVRLDRHVAACKALLHRLRGE